MNQRTSPDFAVWQIPHIDVTARVISGTAAGIGREIGIRPLYVRVLFAILTVAGGWGVPMYLIAWVIMAREGLKKKPYEPIGKAVSPAVRRMAFGMIAFGLVTLSSMYGFTLLSPLMWPSIFLGAAVAVGFDDTLFARFKLQSRNLSARLVLGLGLLFVGIVSASFISLDFWEALSGITVAALVLVGASIIFAPMIRSLGGEVLAERRRRIRSEERADMAAHLHDSVLQTLALIQKRSDDASVVSLARRQERELRTWLFDDKALNPNLGFRAGLEAQMASVEDLYEIPLEVVVVGDCPTDADVHALLQASGEAAANASKHSGANRVDVFAEVLVDAIEVFVRDTGTGFDLVDVDTDRAGVRDSIVGRMERHGGSAIVHSVVGSGTEVELRLPRVRVQSPSPNQVEMF